MKRLQSTGVNIKSSKVSNAEEALAKAQSEVQVAISSAIAASAFDRAQEAIKNNRALIGADLLQCWDPLLANLVAAQGLTVLRRGASLEVKKEVSDAVIKLAKAHEDLRAASGAIDAMKGNNSALEQANAAVNSKEGALAMAIASATGWLKAARAPFVVG